MNSLVDIEDSLATLLLPSKGYDNISRGSDLVHGSNLFIVLPGRRYFDQWYSRSTLRAVSSSFVDIFLSQYVLAPSIYRLTLVSSRIKSCRIQSK